MKKLIISSTSIIGGAEYVLIDYLKIQKNEIILLTSDNKKVLNLYKTLKNISVQKTKFFRSVNASKNMIGKIKKIIFFFFSYFLLKKIIKKNKISVVLGNNTLDIIYSVWVKRIDGKINFNLYIHDMIEENTITSKIIKKLDKNVTKYIVVSKAVKKNLEELGIKQSKINLIYNGLLINPYKEKEKKLEKKIKILFVGMLTNRKDPLEFINFIVKMKKMKVCVEAEIIYNNYECEILSKLRERIKSQNLKVALFYDIERKKIEKHYRENDFLFISSKKDPLPTVVLESMNQGTPVIGKNIDGIPEMIKNEKNGFLFDNKNDYLYIIKKLKKLTNKEYNKMSLECFRFLNENFSIQKKQKKLDKILNGS